MSKDDLFPPDLSLEEWLDALMTPGSEVRTAAAQQSFNAELRSLEAGLRNPHQEGQRLYGAVVFDPRVSDRLVLEIDDEDVSGMRYELPEQDCLALALQSGMEISGVLSFALVSRWKGINTLGEPASTSGAVVAGSVRVESCYQERSGK